MCLELDIPADRLAPARAREALRSLGAQLGSDLAPDMDLLVTELVTNSVKYGPPGIVRIRAHTQHPRHVRVEVIDGGGGFVPEVRDRPRTEAGAWGLHLVDELTDRWGVYAGSTHVWFELER